MVDDGDRMTVDDRDVLGDQSLQRLGISDDPPGVEDDDPVGVPSGEVQLVEHHHDRVAGVRELSGDHRLTDLGHRRLEGLVANRHRGIE